MLWYDLREYPINIWLTVNVCLPIDCKHFKSILFVKFAKFVNPDKGQHN